MWLELNRENSSIKTLLDLSVAFDSVHNNIMRDGLDDKTGWQQSLLCFSQKSWASKIGELAEIKSSEVRYVVGLRIQTPFTQCPCISISPSRDSYSLLKTRSTVGKMRKPQWPKLPFYISCHFCQNQSHHARSFISNLQADYFSSLYKRLPQRPLEASANEIQCLVCT